jgi:hypothetical protein
MIGRLIGGTLAAAVLGAGAVFFGFKGYQAYLRWLVAGQGPGTQTELQRASTTQAEVQS